MKTYQTAPPFDPAFFLRLEHLLPSYPEEATQAPDLLAAWLEKNPLHSVSRQIVVEQLGAMFLFECGRIYGIQQERARRKPQP